MSLLLLAAAVTATSFDELTYADFNSEPICLQSTSTGAVAVAEAFIEKKGQMYPVAVFNGVNHDKIRTGQHLYLRDGDGYAAAIVLAANDKTARVAVDYQALGSLWQAGEGNLYLEERPSGAKGLDYAIVSYAGTSTESRNSLTAMVDCYDHEGTD